ncbi:unnamed protein product [Rhodiola kirilowii]
MLAIFDKSVAVCPDHLMRPRHSSFSALDNGFLVNHFVSVHPDYVVNEIGASAIFAYSLQESPDCPRFRFGLMDGTFCIYQGSMEAISSLREKYCLNQTDDEIDIVIQAYKILQEIGLHTPDHVVSNLIGDFSFVVYASSSKLLLLTSATSGFFPLFWGIDSESSLILSDDPEVVGKANLSMLQPFPLDHIYISCRGLGGLEAIYLAKELEQQERGIEAIYLADELGIQLLETDATDIVSWQWQPPPPNVFKINTHGIAFPKENTVGIGVIIRNSIGRMIVAGCKRVKGCSSQIHAHGLASIEGFRLGLGIGLRNVMLEEVECESNDDSAIVRVSVPDMVSLISQFDSTEFSTVAMSANKAACALAQYAKELVEDCIVWELEIPECISSVVKLESQGHA